MKRYEAPELHSIYFEVKNRIMEDPFENDYDVNENPWGDLFQDSSEDAQGLLD